jgi:3-hydroxybenzoate 6-monooxygenase
VPEFVIAGGGIGGLSAALSIARHGHSVHVVERTSFVESGAGIQLAPNAFHALDRLGVGERVRAAAVPVDDLRLMDGRSGRVLARLPLDASYRERFGDMYAVVERGDLYAPLLESCLAHSRITLSADTALVGYSRMSSSIRCRLSSGRHLDADALIGADGIWSTVRRQLLDDGAPHVSGHTIYRAVIPMESIPDKLRLNSVCLWAGPGWHVVHYPIAGATKMNLAAVRDDHATTVVSGVPVTDERVRAAFPELSRTPRRLLELATGWRTWVLCDRAPVSRWASGRVVLIGDAAHPMLQYAAQGACMALEDAIVLGDLLDCAPAEITGEFERFNAMRRGRTARAQRTARWMGRAMFHASGAEAESRDALLASRSTQDLFDDVAWLHGVRVGRDTERGRVPSARLGPPDG